MDLHYEGSALSEMPHASLAEREPSRGISRTGLAKRRAPRVDKLLLLVQLQQSPITRAVVIGRSDDLKRPIIIRRRDAPISRD